MLCYLVGYKHFQGESKKTGKPYDFYEIYVVAEGDKYTIGNQVMKLTVNPDSISGILPAMLPESGIPVTVSWGFNPSTGKGFVGSVIIGTN